jgi:hypothetical protein
MALPVKTMLGASEEAAVLGLESVEEKPLKCGSDAWLCFRDGSFFLRANSFIFEPRLRFR